MMVEARSCGQAERLSRVGSVSLRVLQHGTGSHLVWTGTTVACKFTTTDPADAAPSCESCALMCWLKEAAPICT